MKNILTTLVLISINICVFAQKTNNRGEYLVKSIHWVNAFYSKKRLATKGISGIISGMTMMET